MQEQDKNNFITWQKILFAVNKAFFYAPPHVHFALYTTKYFLDSTKKLPTLYTDWRPVTICKLLWEGSPNTRSSLKKYCIQWRHPTYTYSSCYFIFLLIQPQDVADLVSSEVRNVLSKVGRVHKSRHKKNKNWWRHIHSSPLQDLHLKLWVGLFLFFLPSLRSIYCCSAALHRSQNINHALLPALSLIAPDVGNN